MELGRRQDQGSARGKLITMCCHDCRELMIDQGRESRVHLRMAVRSMVSSEVGGLCCTASRIDLTSCITLCERALAVNNVSPFIVALSYHSPKSLCISTK